MIWGDGDPNDPDSMWRVPITPAWRLSTGPVVVTTNTLGQETRFYPAEDCTSLFQNKFIQRGRRALHGLWDAVINLSQRWLSQQSFSQTEMKTGGNGARHGARTACAMSSARDGFQAGSERADRPGQDTAQSSQPAGNVFNMTGIRMPPSGGGLR